MRVIRTRLFDRRAREAGLEPRQLDKLMARLVEHPALGDVIPGSGGARKIRIPLPGRGASRGARVIYAIVWRGSALALITIYAKSTQTNLSAEERREIAALISDINQETHGG